MRVWRSRIILFTQQNPINAGSHCYLPDNWIKWQYVQEKLVKTVCAEQINTFNILEGHSIGAIKINTSISRRSAYKNNNNLKQSAISGLYLTKWQKRLSTTEQHIRAPFGLICIQSGLSRQQCHFPVHVCESDASGSNWHSERTCKMNLSLDFHYTKWFY